MIKKLRLKFILISMLSVLFVLVATIGSINIYNYVQVENNANASLTEVIQHGFDDQGPAPASLLSSTTNNTPPPLPDDTSRREGPLVQRQYFLVSFDSNGTIAQSQFNHIFSIGEEQGKNLATLAYNGSISGGKYNQFRYRVYKDTANNITYVAFVDVLLDLESCRSFLIPSIVVSSIAYAALFVLVWFASRIVFKTAEESYQKQKRFITNASHELKTPLTVISTDVEIIEMDNGKSEWSESIKDQVSRLTKMTNQLVTLSKLGEENSKNYPFVTFSLTDLAKECLETFAPSYEKEGLALKGEIEEGVMFNGNKYLIDELLYIFLDNALKYTKNNGFAGLIVKNGNKKGIEIIAYNDIEEDSQIDTNLLFERFYRSPDAKKSGSGIGLSIASEIVNLHKGKINAEIEEGKIYFRVSL